MRKILASELRAGNYHETDPLDIPRMGIHSVRLDGNAFSAITPFGICQVMEEGMEFKPIPITEPWLLAFGFEIWRNEFKRTVHLSHLIVTALNVHVYKNENNGLWCIYFFYDSGTPTANIAFEFVHELQNLYFALAGEDLVLKTVDANKAMIDSMVRAQFGSQEHEQVIKDHMEEYFKRFASYKDRFTPLEWYHIFLDFAEKLEANKKKS